MDEEGSILLVCQLPREGYRLMDENRDHGHLFGVNKVRSQALKELHVNELIWLSHKMPLD